MRREWRISEARAVMRSLSLTFLWAGAIYIFANRRTRSKRGSFSLESLNPKSRKATNCGCRVRNARHRRGVEGRLPFIDAGRFVSPFSRDQNARGETQRPFRMSNGFGKYTYVDARMRSTPFSEGRDFKSAPPFSCFL